MIFSIAEENKWVKGCTISRPIYDNKDFGINFFSMAEETDISKESYAYHKIILNACGELVIYCDKEWILREGDCFITAVNIPVGMKTQTGSIYTEIRLKEGIIMNQVLKDGEVFRLAELIPYQDGRIVNMDLINDPKMKFVVMAFDKGTGLSEHSAPGEALIFALDGEGIIGYEGKEYFIKAGENFKFAKNGKHFVRANGKFKMALLMVLE